MPGETERARSGKNGTGPATTPKPPRPDDHRPAITAAAAILILVFGSFILGGELILRQFRLGPTVAVLIDAFFIRMAINPLAQAIVLGRRTRRPAVWCRMMATASAPGLVFRVGIEAMAG
jgi:hypothetical protein